MKFKTVGVFTSSYFTVATALENVPLAITRAVVEPVRKADFKCKAKRMICMSLRYEIFGQALICVHPCFHACLHARIHGLVCTCIWISFHSIYPTINSTAIKHHFLSIALYEILNVEINNNLVPNIRSIWTKDFYLH